MGPILPPRTRSALACLLAVLSACSPTPGGVHVTVTSSMTPGSDLDQLSVTAFLADGLIPLATQTFAGDALKLPATVNFVSGASTSAGTKVIIEATAELRGEIVSSIRGEAMLEARTGAELTLTLPPRTAVVPDGGEAGPLEVCDNGVDDDGDGRADCADNQCNGKTCAPLGLVCSTGRCNCASGAAGTVSERSGFEPRLEPQAVRITDGAYAGHVAVVGGRSSGATLTPVVELISLTGVNVARASLEQDREGFSLLALPDGGLLVAGGVSGAAARSSYEYFPSDDGGFASVAIAPGLRAVSASALLGADSFILAGGQLQDLSGGGQLTASVVRVFLGAAPDGGAGGRAEVGLMSSARSGRGAVLSTGELLMAGGSAGAPSERTDLINADGVVRTGPPLPVKISDATAVRLKDGRVLILGGRVELASVVPSARAFIVSAAASGLTLRELTPMLSSKVRPRAALLDNGWVYVDDAAGGSTKPEWFDPASETFIAAVTPSSARSDYAVVPAGANSVALVGGGVGGVADGKILTVSLQCQ